MIDKILILACDRPEYLKKCLDSVYDLNIPIEVFVDMPNQASRYPKYKEVLDLLKEYKGVKTLANKQHLGCSASMLNMLSKRGKVNNILILEDDITLNEGAIETINSLIPETPYILKLNNFFWGWVTNSKTLDLIDELTTGSKYDEKYKNDTYYQSLKVFYHEGIHLIWDEVFQGLIGYYDIKEIKTDSYLSKNIGNESSRLSNPQDLQPATYTVFVDGVFQEMKFI